jgi:hypothetical protein
MSASNRNTKKSLGVGTGGNDGDFHLVGDDVFLGLVFASTQNFYYKKNRNLVTIPSFTFYDNQTKVIIDYSNGKNFITDDLSFISSFFGSMTNGITFEYINTQYVNDASDISADISGVYEFESFQSNSLIKANVVSTTDISTTRDFYNSKFFINTPQLTRVGDLPNGIQSVSRTNIIKNTIPNGLYSFTRLGARVGDYIEFSSGITNSGRFKILDLFFDTEGFECIQVDSSLSNENAIGTSVLVNLYFEGQPNGNYDGNNKTYGAGILQIGNFPQICISCQSESQFIERAAVLNANTSSYTPQTTCAELESLSTSVPVSIVAPVAAVAEVVSEVVTTDTPLSSTVRPRTTVKTIRIKLLTVGGRQIITEDTEPLTNIDVKTNTTLKVYLTHPSLVGSSFGFSSTQPTNTVTPILDNIINSGLPGTSNSYISIQVGSQARDLYVVSSSNPSLYFKVTVTI